MSAATTPLTVQLPSDIRERLAELARATDQPEVGLAAEAIRAYVELQEWQIGEIEQGLREAEAGALASDDEVAAVFAKWAHARPLDP